MVVRHLLYGTHDFGGGGGRWTNRKERRPARRLLNRVVHWAYTRYVARRGSNDLAAWPRITRIPHANRAITGTGDNLVSK